MADTNLAAELEASQAKLDSIQEEIIANKVARESLREAARTLRDEYIKEEKIREALLKQVLSEAK